MHILEIPSFFPPYGGEFCLEQAKALKALGHEVRILSNVQLGATINLRDYLSLPYRRFEHERDGIIVYQSYQRGLPKLIHYNVRRWVHIVCSMFDDYVERYGNPDILHAHCAKWAGYAAMEIGKDYKIPYVVTEHLSKQVFEIEFASSDTWQISLLKEAYRNADCVVPVAEELVDSIACYFGKDYRWKSISNVIDTDFYHYQERQPKAGRTFRFCCLANNWPLKGYDILIPAFEQLRANGADAELYIAGRGTDTAEFRKKLSDGIVSYGLLNKEKVRDLLYQSDALVLATRGETQGLVLLEALSTGIPAISTEAIPESVRPHEGCLYVPVDDVDAFADAMTRTMLSPSADGKRLSEQVKALASPQVVGIQLQTIFCEVLALR